eukprot:m.154695 g.154695  ORF g.154695 m.154695 type:complete len:511 (-) comp30903_c0_seq1:2183-3715(-)
MSSMGYSLASVEVWNLNPLTNSMCATLSKITYAVAVGICLIASPSNATQVNYTNLTSMLDSMQRMVDPSKTEFDREFLTSLEVCMDSVDSDLWASQNAAWNGFVEYAVLPNPNDPWGNDCKNYPNGTCDHYEENNRTQLDIQNVSIYEPCNFVSSAAYYRAVPSICQHEQWNMEPEMRRALVQSFAALAMGSSFWHASHTYLGNVCDNHLISVLSFTMHQSSVSALPLSASVVHNLNTTTRPNASASAQQLTDMFRSEPVNSWQATLLNIDVPQYKLTFASIISTWLTLIFPKNIVNIVVEIASEALGLPQNDLDFILKAYLPQLRNATSNITLSHREKVSLGLQGAGTVTKLLYAFMWQENTFPYPILKKHDVDVLGAELMPGVNTLANMFTGFVHTDKHTQRCVDVYPGDHRCRLSFPHAMWHEESANGLTDLVFLADAINAIMKKHLVSSDINRKPTDVDTPQADVELTTAEVNRADSKTRPECTHTQQCHTKTTIDGWYDAVNALL